MTRILIVGDLHMSFAAAQKLVRVAKQEEVDAVWQLGDFGYWPRRPEFQDFLAILAKAEVPILFVDGNHEDHELLESRDSRTGVTQISANVSHVRRGTIFSNGYGPNILFFGGAVSVDKSYRTPGHDWFWDELPTHSQFERALREPVDIVVAHDCPWFVDFGYPAHGSISNPWPEAETRLSESFRRFLEEVALTTKPRLWFAGHHHRRKEFTHFMLDGRPQTVHVMDQDAGLGSCAILDPELMTVTDVRWRSKSEAKRIAYQKGRA